MDKVKLKKTLITIKTACDILQVSMAKMRKWDKEGILTSLRHPKNGYRLYNISKLESFAKSHNLKRSSHHLSK